MLHSVRNYVLQVPTCLTIVAGLALVSYQQWVGPLPVRIQLIFCIGLLLIAGIPHGALDHLIEEAHSTRRAQPFSMTRFIIRYVLTVILYGIGWFFFPVLSLVLFLLISAWHFGETDIENAPSDAYWSLARLMAGGWVLAFILLTHAAETTPILARIVHNDDLFMPLWHGAVTHAGPVLRGWATLAFVVAMLAYGQQPIQINSWRLARLGLVLALTYPLPLLPAFMLYFGGWHALSSFGNISAYLRIPAYSWRNSWKLWQQSLPLTAVAFLFLGVCAVVWFAYIPQFDPLPILFILLSTITLPHIQVMHHLTENNK